MVTATGSSLAETVVPTLSPTAKVFAASAGAAIGGTVGTIASWIIAAYPAFEQASAALQAGTPVVLTALCSALGAGLAGWLRRPDPDTRLVFDEDNRPRMARRMVRRVEYR
ncbi:MAG TPA: hypothetical protein VHU15_00615 [Stellaceae bacterium]|jgi:hypothetical protein|nr:hypothetical protein [Stellaceae bacterium]